ncbi:MAG: hypothetical protein KKE20_01130 [Nanoarchaeota archaeon]|nr:hypothetical protein [Nanoarchaeota archaeon]
MDLKRVKSFCRRFRLVFFLLFIIDLIIPDPIPLLDEVVLGLAAVYGWI